MEGKQNYILNNGKIITICPSSSKAALAQAGSGGTPNAGTAVCAPFITMASKV